MNIALVPTVYFPRSGGVSVTAQNLANAFVQKGHSVVIVTPKLKDTDASFEIIDGIEVYRMPFVFPWRLLWENRQESFLKFCLSGPGVVRQLARLIRHKRIEIINVHHFGSQLPYLFFAQLFAPGPTILTLYGNELFRLSSLEKIRCFLLRYAFRRAKQIIASSSSTADDIARFSPNASSKIVKISPGVITDDFASPRRNGPPFPTPYILSLSRLNTVKGHDVLLAAFQKVAKQEKNLHLVVAADGPQRTRLQAVAMSLGLKDRVTFLGQVNRGRVRELLAGCEFLVNCSWIEGIPNAVLEAMASGKPVIGMNVGGTPEVVADYERGRLVPPGDAEGLEEAMLFLFRNRDYCKTMGERGQAFVKAHHDFAKSVDRYLEVYKRVFVLANEGGT